MANCKKCENQIENLMLQVMGGPERCEAEGHDRTSIERDGFWCGRCNTVWAPPSCSTCGDVL